MAGKRKRMTMYERRRMAKSPYIKYDKSKKLWIQHRKVVYLYWFKFLQHSERDPTFTVDWSKYSQWGTKEAMMNTKFDEWWQSHWETLFSFKEGCIEDALFFTKLSPDTVWMRTCLLIYENRHRGDKWAIGCYVKKSEELKGRTPAKTLKNAIPDLFEESEATQDEIDFMSSGQRMKRQQNIIDLPERIYKEAGKRVISRERTEEISTAIYDIKMDKKRVQQYIGRYQKQTRDLMKNISDGSLDPTESNTV